MRTRPVVTIHLAQSLDGRMALDGAMTALSTTEGRTCAHAARAVHDAVLVGATTVRIDDPLLTVRDASLVPSGDQPLRVVLASTLSLPRGARVLARDGRALIIGADGRVDEEERRALELAGVGVAIAPRDPDGYVSIDGTLSILAERGVRSVLVEGGSRVVTSFLRARRVDRMCVEIAMRLLGAPGTPTLGSLAVSTLPEAPSLANVSVERLGENIFVRGDVVYR